MAEQQLTAEVLRRFTEFLTDNEGVERVNVAFERLTPFTDALYETGGGIEPLLDFFATLIKRHGISVYGDSLVGISTETRTMVGSEMSINVIHNSETTPPGDEPDVCFRQVAVHTIILNNTLFTQPMIENRIRPVTINAALEQANDRLPAEQIEGHVAGLQQLWSLLSSISRIRNSDLSLCFKKVVKG